jgi:hypothetical protein
MKTANPNIKDYLQIQNQLKDTYELKDYDMLVSRMT